MNETMTPQAAGSLTLSLQESLAEGKHGLDAVPKLIKRIIRDELWRSFYCKPVLSQIEFSTFEKYVTDDLPTGLGTTVQMLKNICRDDDEALSLIDAATQRKAGDWNTHPDPKVILDNIQDNKAPTGTSKDAALRRLRKDRADLHEKVIAGEISAHAAMIDAGFRKKPTPEEVCVKAFRKAENRMEALRLIASELQPHEAAVVRDWIVEEAGTFNNVQDSKAPTGMPGNEVSE